MAFRDYILDRFWLKLFSFILAALIWFTVTNVQTEPRFASNPFRPVDSQEISRVVRLATLPTTRRFFKIEPVEVRITVRGNTSALNQLGPNDIEAFVNLTDALDSAASYEVEVKNIPRNLRVQDITPRMVMVEPIRPN